jgi:hypothetical protein
LGTRQVACAACFDVGDILKTFGNVGKYDVLFDSNGVHFSVPSCDFCRSCSIFIWHCGVVGTFPLHARSNYLTASNKSIEEEPLSVPIIILYLIDYQLLFLQFMSLRWQFSIQVCFTYVRFQVGYGRKLTACCPRTARMWIVLLILQIHPFHSMYPK